MTPRYLLVVVATVHMLGLNRKDRMYNPLPLYHLAGGLVGTGAALVDGIPSVLRAKFSASNYWTDCIKYDCTVRGLQPFFIAFRPLKYNFKSSFVMWKI